MQRYSWEQGAAAHAFLESGDRDIVVLMAREAAVRQLSPGTAPEGQAFFLLMEASAKSYYGM